MAKYVALDKMQIKILFIYILGRELSRFKSF